MSCGLDPNISSEWQRYFSDLKLGVNHFTIRCMFSELMPTGAIILFNCYIIYHLIHTHHHLYRTRGRQLRKEQIRSKSWMSIILILHSLLFLASLFSHIVGHIINTEAHETWWVLLAVLVNCSLNFYVYCLSGEAFRNEIYRRFQRLKIRFFSQSQSHQQQSSQSQKLMCELRNLEVPRPL